MSDIYAVDHMQLSMPPDKENRARAFYIELLGFTEVPKPAPLAGRGGAWFESVRSIGSPRTGRQAAWGRQRASQSAQDHFL